MKTIISTILSAIAALAFFAGCSSKPGLSDGESALRSNVEAQSENRLKLVRFKKTGDEPSMQFPGDKVQTFYWTFEGEVEAVENCVWLYDRTSGSVLLDFRTARSGEPDPGASLQQGERYSLNGSVSLIKEAKGWKVSSIHFRQFPRPVQ